MSSAAVVSISVCSGKELRLLEHIDELFYLIMSWCACMPRDVCMLSVFLYFELIIDINKTLYPVRMQFDAWKTFKYKIRMGKLNIMFYFLTE